MTQSRVWSRSKLGMPVTGNQAPVGMVSRDPDLIIELPLDGPFMPVRSDPGPVP